MTEQRKVVAFDRGRRRPDPARVNEFAATARRLQREREEAGDVITRLLRETPRSEWPRLAENDALRNSGALDRLSREIVRRESIEPQEALALANLATTLAETLPTDGYPAVVVAQLRAHAWKDRAQVLSYLGRYDESLTAFDRAEDQLAAFGTVAHDRAIIWLARAITLQRLRRFDESVALLNDARNVFLDHGDFRLQLQCGMVEANLLYRQYRYAEAQDLFAALLEPARALGDSESEARLHNNLGCCAVQINDFTRADAHFSEAVARFRDLGKELEAIRSEMQAGRLLLGKGEEDAALPRLQRARSLFLFKGLVEEAGLCGLEIATILIAQDRATEARILAQEIVAQFVEARFDARVMTALAYLREAAEAERLSSEAVRHVHDYLQTWRDDPAREFTALP